MSLLTLKSLEIIGFRSFKNKQVFQLDRPYGLYYVTGINKVQTRLGSNGAGKSTILCDVIPWVLFGKTIRELSGPKIKNRNSKVCKGALRFSRDGIDCILTRTQTPNSITIEPGLSQLEVETIDQKTLNNFLGFSYEQFLYSTISGPFNKTFLDLLPTERLNSFTPLLDQLQVWDNCAKVASTEASSYEENIAFLNTEKHKIEGRLAALDSELLKLHELNKQFENDRLTKTHTLTLAIDSCLQAINIKAQEILTLGKTIQRRKDDLLDREFDGKRLQENLDKITESKEVINSSLVGFQTRRGTAKLELDTKWKSAKDCPWCSRPMEAELIKSHKNRLISEILELDRSIQDKSHELENLVKQYDFNKEKLLEIEQSKKKTDSDLSDCQQKLDLAKHESVMKEGERALRLGELKTLQDGISPYLSMITDCNTNLADVREALSANALALQKAEADSLGTQFWIKGFKELRLWLISDALLALEIESNNALAKLGLNEWSLKFKLERETTTGGIAKGFYILVKSPEFEGDEYIPFETWSGGETTRLRLAGTKGFSNLIKNYKGIDFNIEVYDEPTNLVNAEGIEDFLQFLADEAEEKQKTIYIIDHHSLSSELFKEVITIQKDKSGSKIL